MKFSQRRLARPSLAGMMATRQGSLTLAVICAAAAAGVLIFALGRYKASLRTPTAQATVLVATAQIPRGTAGTTIAAEHLYRSMPVVGSQVSPGALSDAGALSSERTQSVVLPGQQLTTGDFAPLSTVAETLAPNERAVSLAVTEAPGDNDVVQPGDHVDIYSAFKTSNGEQATALVIGDALVVKPATNTPVKTNNVTISGGSMVVAVPSNQVAPLIFAEQNGSLYVSLRPIGAASTPSGILTQKQALSGYLNGSGNPSSKISQAK